MTAEAKTDEMPSLTADNLGRLKSLISEMMDMNLALQTLWDSGDPDGCRTAFIALHKATTERLCKALNLVCSGRED